MRGRGRGSRSAQPPPQRPPGPEPIFPALPLTFQSPCAQRMLAHGQGQRLTLSSQVGLPLAGGRAAAGSRGRRPWAEAAAQGPLHASPSVRTGPSQWPASKSGSLGETRRGSPRPPRRVPAAAGRGPAGRSSGPRRGGAVCARGLNPATPPRGGQPGVGGRGRGQDRRGDLQQGTAAAGPSLCGAVRGRGGSTAWCCGALGVALLSSVRAFCFHYSTYHKYNILLLTYFLVCVSFLPTKL